MSIENVLWKAIEGRLGAQKTAELQNQPLHKLARHKVHREHGIDVGDAFTLGDAVGSLGISWRKKTAVHRSIVEGLDALVALDLPSTEKTAAEIPEGIYPSDASLFTKIAGAQKIRHVKAIADPQEREVLASLQRRVDRDVVNTVTKLASGVLQGISKNPIAREMGRGALMSIGAAVPTVAVGNHLINNAQQSADESSARAIDHAHAKAVDTAKVLALLGVGTYSAGSAINHMLEKESNYVEDEEPQADLDLATALYVEELLSDMEQTDEVAEARALNDEFLVNLLSEEQQGV